MASNWNLSSSFENSSEVPHVIQSYFEFFGESCPSFPSYVSPGVYITCINGFLKSYGDHLEKYSCNVQNTLPKLISVHSERLLLLSSLEYILQQPSQGNNHINTWAENDSSDSRNIYDQLQQVKRKDTTDQERSKENIHFISSNPSKSALSSGTISWCKEISFLLLETDGFINIMMQLHQNGCLFESYLAKKIIIACVKSNSLKANIVLKCSEDSISKHLENPFQIFDLLCEFVSSRRFGKDSPVANYTCDWFAVFLKDELFISLSNILEKQITEHKYKELINYFSFLTKVMKHWHEKCKDIPDEILEQAFCFLIKCLHAPYLDRDNKHPFLYALIVKIIKLLNFAFSVDIILRKQNISTKIVEVAVRVVSNFSDLFTSLSPAYLSVDKSFWGDFNQVTRNRNITQKPHCYKSIARQFLLVSLKACLFSTFSDSFQDLEAGKSVCLIMDTFKMCFHDQRSELPELEWLPAFLGDQDDKWIAALLCLLLIYKKLNKWKRTSDAHLRDAKYPVTAKNSPEHDDTYCGDATTIDEHNTLSLCSVSKDHSKIIEIFGLICPHRLFLQFANFIVYDHHVITDFLLSPETYFLAYFTKYISILNDEWDIFSSICNISNVNRASHDENQVKGNTDLICHTAHILNKADISDNLNLDSHSDEDTDLLVRKDNCDDNSSSCHSNYHHHQTPIRRDDLTKEVPKKKIKLNDCSSMTQKYETSQDFSSQKCQDDQKISFPLVSYTDSEESESDFETGNCKDLLECRKSCDNEFSSVLMSKHHNHVSDSVLHEQMIESISTVSNKSVSHILSRSRCGNLSKDNEKDGDDAVQSNLKEKSINRLERFMTMLIRLQLHLERLDNQGLIPFKIHFLLKILNSCVDKYESC